MTGAVELTQGAVGELADRFFLRQRKRRELHGATEMGADAGDGVEARALAEEEDPVLFQKGDALLESPGITDAEPFGGLIENVRHQRPQERPARDERPDRSDRSRQPPQKAPTCLIQTAVGRDLNSVVDRVC